MLITTDFFTGDIFIANLKESCDKLSLFEWIYQWEKQCLRITLGDCLYDDLIEQLEWSEEQQKYVLKDDADEKWGWLLYGHTYTKDDIESSPNFNYFNCGCGCNNNNCDTFHWDGIINIATTRIPNTTINGEVANAIVVKKSYIAYYIYWLFSLNEDSFTSSTGEQVAEVKGGARISNSHKRIDAHNKFVSWVIECNSHGKVGLYRFLQDFSNSFPEWSGKCLKYEPIW